MSLFPCPTGQNVRELGGNGAIMVGTYGRRGMNLDAVGLVFSIVITGPQRGPSPVISRVLPAGAGQTEFVGGPGGSPFVEASPTAAPLIGFRYSFGSWNGRTVLQRLDPIFSRSPAGITGMRIVAAKDGYVVSGLTVETDGTNVTALRITFARFEKDRLVLDDAYKSDWLGLSTGEGSHDLAGDGRLIVGTCGRRGLNLDALGVVVVPAK